MRLVCFDWHGRSVIHPETDCDDGSRKKSQYDDCGDVGSFKDNRLIQPRHDRIDEPEEQEGSPECHLICPPFSSDPEQGDCIDDERDDKHELHFEICTGSPYIDIWAYQGYQEQSANCIADVTEACIHNGLSNLGKQSISFLWFCYMALRRLALPPYDPDGKEQRLEGNLRDAHQVIPHRDSGIDHAFNGAGRGGWGGKNSKGD